MLTTNELSVKQNATPPLIERSRGNGVASSDDLPKILTKTEEASSTYPARLAWSSRVNNKISIVELETKQNFASFDGVKLNNISDEFYNWTIVKEIANSELLVSVHQYSNMSANLEVFDVSRKGQVQKVYSFEEVAGFTGYGDVTYNSRRSVMGALSVAGKIAYHLYNFSTSKSGNIVKLIRKSRWHSQCGTEDIENVITSLDFNPKEELVATIDRYGTCRISEMNTENYSFHLALEMSRDKGDATNRCRWSTNDEPLLFLKYNLKHLNILDAEKKVLTLKYPILTDKTYTFGIDICQNNGNLLAMAGYGHNIAIFDKREAKIVQTIGNNRYEWIYCVRWSPNGDMIARTSFDKTVALLDFKTGKVLYTGMTPDGHEKKRCPSASFDTSGSSLYIRIHHAFFLSESNCSKF